MSNLYELLSFKTQLVKKKYESLADKILFLRFIKNTLCNMCCFHLFKKFVCFSICVFVSLLFPLKAIASTLISPKNNAIIHGDTIKLNWNSIPNASNYTIQIAFDSQFVQLDTTFIVSQTFVDLPAILLNRNVRYFWRTISDGNIATNIWSFRIFRPDDLNTINTWLSANSQVTRNVTNDVSGWASINTPSVSFSQATASLQPKWNPSVPTINNLPSVFFDGSKRLITATPVSVNNFTAFFVRNYIPSSPSRPLQYFFAGNAQGFYSENNNSNHGFGHLNGSLNRAANKAALNTQYAIYSHLNSRLFMNGTETNYAATGAPTALAISAIGTRPDATTFSFAGNIAEIILYSDALPDSSRQLVEQYLRFKYAPPVNLGPDITVNYGFCPVSLNAQKDYFTSYLWSNGATTASVNISYPGGPVWVQTTDIFGYTSTDTVVITYPGTLQFPSSSAICLGDTFTANTNLVGSYTFLWSNAAATAAIAITQEGNYQVTVTDDNSCSTTSNLFFVDVDSFKTLISLGPDVDLCADNTIGLTNGASLVATYAWSTGATTATIPVTVDGDYAVTVTNALGCTATDTIGVTILGQAPFVDFTADTVCLGTATTFNNLSSFIPPATAISYSWNFGATTSADISPTFIFPDAGSYAVTLTATTNVGCAASVVRSVLVRPNPTANFDLSLDACVDNPYSFVSNSSVPAPDLLMDVNWDFGNGNNAAGSNVAYAYPAAGIFNVTLSVTSAFGCSSAFSNNLNVVSSAPLPGIAILQSPAQSFISASNSILFSWLTANNSISTNLQIASDTSFNNVIINQNLNSISSSALVNNLPYQKLFWRVLNNNICGEITTSAIQTFTVIDLFALGTLEVWLDAGNAITRNVTNDVSGWASINTPSVSFSQATASLQPKWNPSVPTINNLPSVFFDGSKRLITATPVSVNNFTAFFVRNYIPSSPSRPLQYFFAGNAQGFYSENNNSNHGFGHLNGSLNRAANKAALNTQYAIYSHLNSRLFMNGTETNYAATGAPTALAISAIGTRPDATTFSFAGNIAEIILYSDALPDSSRQLVEQYLRFKYAPPVNLGPDITVNYGFCPVSLNAQKDYFASYTWSTGDTTATLNIRNSGTYSITVTDIFGFTSIDTINISIPQRPTLTGNQIICEDLPETFDINVGNGYAYEWNGTDLSSTFITDTAGTFFYTIYDTISCFFSDTITVSVDSFKTYLSLGDDTSLCSNNKILIADTGNYSIGSYLWSTNQTTATATINQTGNYSLTATNSNGCIGTDVVFVNVLGEAPDVDFTINNFCLGDTTRFNDDSDVIGSNITAWDWDFGDNTTANVASPTHVFPQATDYNVTLEVTAASGCKEKATQTISIYPLPVANFTNELSCAGTSTQFNDISTISGLNTITGWIWNFDRDTATDRNPIYTFLGKGEYDVSLSVTSDKGCSSTVTKTIEVFNELIADFSTGNLCFGDSARFFDETNSLSIIKYEWEFGDGRTSSTKNPANMYLTTGGYNVTLKVTNAIGCISEKQDSINIFESPIADFTFNGVCLGSPIQFIDVTNAQGDSVIRQFWNFGDGFQTITGTNPYYQYDSAATYTVWHRVLTANGCNDTVTKQVTIQLPPVADFSFTPDFGAAPLVVNFTNNSSADVTKFFWFFTNDEIIDSTTIENPEYTFSANDEYEIKLVVYSNDNCMNEKTKSIKVAESILDIAVTNVTVLQDLMNDGNYKVITVAEITNVGTRDVKSFDIQSKISNNIALQETWEGNLPFGTKINYVFDASYIAASEENKTFICIEALRPNNEADENPADNRNCIALENNIKVLPVYPNPSRDNITLDIILPKDGKVTVTIYSALGAQLTALDNDLKKGFNSLNFNVKTMGKGVYILKTNFDEDMDIQKFMVE